MNRMALIFGLCSYFYLMTNVIFPHLYIKINSHIRMNVNDAKDAALFNLFFALIVTLMRILLDIIANDKFLRRELCIPVIIGNIMPILRV